MSIAHFQSTCQALIQIAVESLASAPHFTPAQKKTRTEAVVNLIMAFLPTEPIQVMLASQAVGHHVSLMDTFQQIHNRALSDNISVKMRTISLVETRMVLALVKELRVVRKEMIAAAQSERAATPARPVEPPPPAAEPPAAEPPAAEPPAAEPPATELEASRPLPAGTVDDAAFAAHIADYENALLAPPAALEEARARDKPTAAAAIGHPASVTPPGLAAAIQGQAHAQDRPARANMRPQP